MDRFTALGLAFDAATQSGRCIAVIAPRRQEARQALEAIAQLGDIVAHATIRRTNGDEQIRFQNGSVILLRSAGQSLRGRSLDCILVHSDIPRHLLSTEQWRKWQLDSIPCLSSRDGDFILSW